MNKLKYKIAASDFDGTLLRSDNTIGKYTKDAIERYLQSGGLFMIATGRMHRAIVNRLEDAGLKGYDIPLISYQGALVILPDSNKIISSIPMKKSVALEIANEAKRQDIYFHTYIDDTLYVSKEMPWTRQYVDYLGIDFVEVGDLIEYMKRELPEDNQEGRVCHKVLMMLPADKIDQKLDEFKNIFKDKAIFNTSSVNLLECISPLAGKDKAIEMIARERGLSLDDVMTFGDSLNDYTMVARAGLGVAVENAVPELKQAAKYITDSNDDDGVGKALEKLAYER